MILADLVDLTVRRFEHGDDLGDLGSLREPSELVGSYSQVSTWSFVDVVTVDTDKIIVKVAMERPPLRVELVVVSGLSHRKGALIFMAMCAVDIPVFTSGAFLIGFAISRRAVDADVEDQATPERWERGLLGEGFDRVSVEPWDSEFGFSSRLVWRDAPGLGLRAAC